MKSYLRLMVNILFATSLIFCLIACSEISKSSTKAINPAKAQVTVYMTLLARIQPCKKIGAMQRLSNMVENVSYLTVGTIQIFWRTTQRC